METKRKALGKGLEQLFSNEVINFEEFEHKIVDDTPKGDVTLIPLSEIHSNPYQPRKTFDEETLKELAESIKEYGVIEPIIVKKTIKGYDLIAGERRTKASRLAGLERIPAVIKEFTDDEMLEIALLENIQREDLNPIDEALAYEQIINLRHMTQEEFAKKFGKSRSYVTNMLGLLNLPEDTKNLVRRGKISMGHARSLSKLSNIEKVKELSEKIVAEDLSVRALEEIISEDDSRTYKTQRKEYGAEVDIRNNIYEKLLREKIGARVKITKKKIEIPYDSPKDLERILEILDVNVEGV